VISNKHLLNSIRPKSGTPVCVSPTSRADGQVVGNHKMENSLDLLTHCGSGETGVVCEILCRLVAYGGIESSGSRNPGCVEIQVLNRGISHTGFSGPSFMVSDHFTVRSKPARERGRTPQIFKVTDCLLTCSLLLYNLLVKLGIRLNFSTYIFSIFNLPPSRPLHNRVITSHIENR
jgi:hypothetical protein